MPRASFVRRRELAARGRDYQLIPTFPRLPGIIPEDPASRPPFARQLLRRPSVLSKNLRTVSHKGCFLARGGPKKFLRANNLCKSGAVKLSKSEQLHKFAAGSGLTP
jgi:hypothetical protein